MKNYSGLSSAAVVIGALRIKLTYMNVQEELLHDPSIGVALAAILVAASVLAK